MKKKLLSVLLVMCLAIAFAPAALADTAAAQVGDTPYDTVQAAIDAAGSGDTVTLLKDVAENVKVENKKLTIDLNGKTITSNAGHAVKVVNSNVTIVDSGNGGGIIMNTDWYCLAIQEGSTLTMRGGKLTLNHPDAMAIGVYTSADKAYIEGGEIVSNGAAWPMYAWDNGVISISGGTFDFGPNSNYVADEYTKVENSDGTYTVKAMQKSVYLNGTSYLTLADAFADAQPNDTITITEAGEYVWPNTLILAGVTVKGTVDGVVVRGTTSTTTINATTLKVENIHFKNSWKGAFVGNGKASDLTFTDCAFTGTYAFHVDSAKQGAKLTFNNCAFNGFTTFASTVEEVVVNDGEINGDFIIRQDAKIEGTDFSEDAALQLGTSDTVTDVEVSIADCTVKNENGEVSDKTVADLFVSNNDEDEKNNQIIIDEDTYVGTPSEAPAFKYLDGDTYTNQPDGLSFKKTNVVFARTKAVAVVYRLIDSYTAELVDTFHADSCDPALVKFESGSIKVTLQQAYLDSLPDGTYALLIDADKTDDDNADVVGEFIVNKLAAVPTYSAPQTGDNSQLLLWAGMMIVAVIGMVAFGKKHTATDR